MVPDEIESKKKKTDFPPWKFFLDWLQWYRNEFVLVWLYWVLEIVMLV